MNLKSYEFQVGFKEISPSESQINEGDFSKNMTWIKNPFLSWVADPFLFKYGNQYYLFAESASRLTGKGKIVYLCVSAGDKKWKTAMKQPFHLSFPNIRRENGEIFMTPETYQDNCIANYRCVSFPNEWVKAEAFVKDGKYVDSIFIDNKCTKILSYRIGNDMPYLEEFVRKGDEYTSVWAIPDQGNILRPAGSLVSMGNDVVFVSQDCTETYGGGIIFSSLSFAGDKLSLKEICRTNIEKVQTILNDKSVVGLHTFNILDNYLTIDIKREKFTISGFLHKCFSKIANKDC